MKTRIFNKEWMCDEYDITDKVIEIFYCESGDWHPLHVLINTNDGRLENIDGKWTRTTVPVNIKQLRERVTEFLNSDCPCFDDVWEDCYLVTMRDNMLSGEYIQLAEIW